MFQLIARHLLHTLNIIVVESFTTPHHNCPMSVQPLPALTVTAPHGVEPFSKLFNYFKILHGSGLFIQHELSINRFFVAPASDDFPDFREII